MLSKYSSQRRSPVEVAGAPAEALAAEVEEEEEEEEEKEEEVGESAAALETEEESLLWEALSSPALQAQAQAQAQHLNLSQRSLQQQFEMECPPPSPPPLTLHPTTSLLNSPRGAWQAAPLAVGETAILQPAHAQLPQPHTPASPAGQQAADSPGAQLGPHFTPQCAWGGSLGAGASGREEGEAVVQEGPVARALSFEGVEGGKVGSSRGTGAMDGSQALHGLEAAERGAAGSGSEGSICSTGWLGGQVAKYNAMDSQLDALLRALQG